MTNRPRLAGPAALLAAVVAGLAWAPTFALVPLLAPVLAAVVPVLLVDQSTMRNQRLAVVRPIAGLLVGAAAVAAVFILVDRAAPAAVLDGVVRGLQRTLESTIPARSDVDLVAFVPALTLGAGVLGVEWTRRGAAPLVTLLPSFAVLVTAQVLRAAQGWAAVATAIGYGIAVAAVLATGRTGAARGRIVRRVTAILPLLVPLLLVGGGVAAGAAAVTEASGRPAYSVQDGHDVATRFAGAANPLSEIGERLARGNTTVFTVRSDTPVDRWPLVVLDSFDGTNWSTSSHFRILGTELPAPVLAVPAATAHAEVSGLTLDGPWLPTQPRLQEVLGVRTLVDPVTGVLVRDAPGTDYRLRWASVRISRDQLTGAAIDPAPTGAVQLTSVPAGIADLARTAVGAGVGPSVQSALLLEKWMHDTFTVASGKDIPTGHSYAQLLHFLTVSKRGTSEQFATAYAILARSIGIPTRVAVGFRDNGSGTVNDSDVLAWPEVAVLGLGWVPLDPTGGAQTAAGTGGGLAAATQAAREDLPTSDQLAARQAGAPAPVAAAPATSDPGMLWLILPAAAALLIVGVPGAKMLRRWVRRRRVPRASVAGAWAEVRDAQRDQGMRLPAGATVRDLVLLLPAEATSLDELARCVDDTLWSGSEVDRSVVDRAWAASRQVRRSLQRRSPSGRLRAAFAVTSFSVRRQSEQAAPRRG